ncbi:MAG: hypothetical protein K8J31_23145 [Anaerolineae bacterium]|nr:hypothetical protein [Anaerolineae bacterium]
MNRYIAAAALVLLLIAALNRPAQTQDSPSSSPLRTDAESAAPYIRSARLGITHISLAEARDDEARYARALSLGAGWNRWPLYWDRVASAPGVYDWQAYDRLVNDDLRHGLQINAILMGRPRFAQEGEHIKGLQQPIFADGSDYPEPDKAINPANLWASFVFEAVRRYRPGGEQAQAEDWAEGEGVRVWEIWNEPDYETFWQGSINAYARLLKVAYLAAKQADPDSVVMFGGLLFAGDDNWLARVLKIYEDDPLHVQFNWYMDQVAVHNYSYPWRSGWLTLYIRQTLSAYQLRKPIWLNESGVRVWDDYPGPQWAADQPDLREQRATEQQQASFFIQSAAYAWSEGADVVFFHQLFDDCGDQPAGTDFAPNQGELCVGGAACFGDAYGLYRNERDSVCFSQHPEPGTARPAAAAYRLMAEIFGTQPFENPRTKRMANGRVQVIAFERPASSERVYVVWNRTFDPLTFELPASSDSAQLMTVNSRRTIQPDQKVYRLNLPPAEPDNYPKLEYGDESAIGGPPLIVIEPSTDLRRVPEFLLPPSPTPTPSPTFDATQIIIVTQTAEASITPQP